MGKGKISYIAGPSFDKWQDIYAEFRSTFDTAGPSPPKWVFRGQADASWSLETSFEREVKKHGWKPSEFGMLEEGMVREFQRRLPSAWDGSRLPDADNVLAWLALMQHHGAPTRLMDWTYSFFIALFFATESAVGDAAVFAVDGRWCNRESRRQLPSFLQDGAEIAKDPYFTTSAAFSRLLSRDPEVPLVYRVNTLVLNTRLALQQGLFLVPGAISLGFEDNLHRLCSSAPPTVHKWIIKQHLHDEIRRELSYMNISSQSLFPGIDGFARSIRHFLRDKDRLTPPWRAKHPHAPFENWMRWG